MSISWITRPLSRRAAQKRGLAPLYFVHIPKTAGSSVASWLSARFGPDSVCPARIWDDLVRMDPAEISLYPIFAGHFAMDLAAFIGSDVVSATVLRNPVDRTLSHYRHVFRKSRHPRHSYVVSQSFDEFVLDQNNWPMIENFQARYLLQTPLDFRFFVSRLGPTENTRGRLSLLSEEARYAFDKAYVEDMALRNLDSLRIVGTTDRLGEFLSAVATAMDGSDASVSPEVPRENEAGSEAAVGAISERSLEVIAKLTEIDQKLYRAARTRLTHPSPPLPRARS